MQRIINQCASDATIVSEQASEASRHIDGETVRGLRDSAAMIHAMLHEVSRAMERIENNGGAVSVHRQGSKLHAKIIIDVVL